MPMRRKVLHLYNKGLGRIPAWTGTGWSSWATGWVTRGDGAAWGGFVNRAPSHTEPQTIRKPRGCLGKTSLETLKHNNVGRIKSYKSCGARRDVFMLLGWHQNFCFTPNNHKEWLSCQSACRSRPGQVRASLHTSRCVCVYVCAFDLTCQHSVSW